MSSRHGGVKKRRYANMRGPSRLRWSCPGCGAGMIEIPSWETGGPVKYLDKCGACKRAMGEPRRLEASR